MSANTLGEKILCPDIFMKSELNKTNQERHKERIHWIWSKIASMIKFSRLNACFFTESTQFQPTYTVSRLHVATTTVPSGCRVNWAIDILVTFPQLLWLHYSVISYRISPRVPRRSCETMDQYEAQYWEPLLNCCTYSTVYYSAE